MMLASLLVSAAVAGAPAATFHDLKALDIDGKPVSLSTYKGKVVLVVNTASFCGHTPQYEGLEKLHETYTKQGLVVVAFPSNDFGKQEPGTEKEIKEFCINKYAVKFPIMEKVVTQGAGQHPVYAFLTAGQDPPKWNFHKYLVGKDGRVITSFATRVKPDAPELKDAIEKALAAK